MNLRKLAAFSLGPLGSAALSFLIVPLTAWYYPVDAIGRIALFQVGINFCLLLFSLGLDQAYVREYHETDHKQALLQSCILPGLLLLLLVLAVFLIFPHVLSRWVLGVSSAIDGVLLAACFLMAYVSRFLSLVLRMEERGLIFSLSQLLPKVGFLIVMGLFIANSDQTEFKQLLIAHAVASACVTLWLIWSTRTAWRSGYSEMRHIDWGKLASFGFPLVFSGLAFWGMTSLDRVFLRHFSNFEQLGLYAVATSFAGVAVIVQSIFSLVWAPMIYKKAVNGLNSEEIHGVVEKLLAVVMLLFSCCGLFSWVIDMILPDAYREARYIFCACLTYPLLYTLSEATGIGLGVKRKSGLAMIAMLAALLVNGLLNALLIHKFGAAGAAASSSIAFYVLFYLKTEFSKRCGLGVGSRRHYLPILCCVAISCFSAIYRVEWIVNLSWLFFLFYSIYFAISLSIKSRFFNNG